MQTAGSPVEVLGIREQARPAASTAASDVLAVLARVGARSCSVENGRSAAVAIADLGAALAASRIPAVLLAPLVRSLLGLLHVRCAALHVLQGFTGMCKRNGLQYAACLACCKCGSCTSGTLETFVESLRRACQHCYWQRSSVACTTPTHRLLANDSPVTKAQGVGSRAWDAQELRHRDPEQSPTQSDT